MSLTHYEVEHHIEQYYDSERECTVKKIWYICAKCHRMRCEKYDCYLPPPKHKDKNKVLQRNKRRISDR